MKFCIQCATLLTQRRKKRRNGEQEKQAKGQQPSQTLDARPQTLDTAREAREAERRQLTVLTPLVGRERELGLLWERWEQAKEGLGQVVLLTGEPGIGKSHLMQELKERVGREGYTRLE